LWPFLTREDREEGRSLTSFLGHLKWEGIESSWDVRVDWVRKDQYEVTLVTGQWQMDPRLKMP
jgi:hypothetical protein